MTIALIVYIIGFIATLVISYRVELKYHYGDDFAWCWGCSFLWPVFWPVYLIYIFRLDYIDRFHKHLKKQYGRK